MKTTISLCICTYNRPEELNSCLESIFKNAELPKQVIVSDDSADGRPTQAVVAQYPSVLYQEGPHRGLGPNRNACIQNATGSHIIFIDDDVCVSPDFFETAHKLIESVDSETIITGYEVNYRTGEPYKVTPHNIDFWGIQRVPVRDEYRSIVINSTIFPRDVFARIKFDEQLRYGCDEVDVAQHAISLGYRIDYRDELYVNHYPSPINRDQYRRFSDASRLYAITKIYWRYERSLPKAIAYLLLAPLQQAVYAVRKGDAQNFWSTFQSTALAYQYLFNQMKQA